MVSVVDADRDAARSICWLLSRTGQSTREYDSAEEFLASYNDDLSGCLILAHSLPGICGLELHQHLAARGCSQPFIILLTANERVADAVDSLQAGAFDCLVKPCLDRLSDAVSRACEADAAQRRQHASQRAVAKRMATLSPREKEVLDFVLAGRPTKDIAARMAISEKTVHVHRSNLARKMRVESASDVVRLLLASQSGPDRAGWGPIDSESGHPGEWPGDAPMGLSCPN